jgi:hypothetical protein
MEESEFGRGMVICLVKFSEHLESEMYRRAADAAWWLEQDEATRENKRAEAIKYPIGDSARLLINVESVSIGGSRTEEQGLSDAITVWMNGASDHFYDLDENAPESLKGLASLCLRIGHGFRHDEVYTMETMNLIHRLWKLACIELDEMLGVKEPDWGQW